MVRPFRFDARALKRFESVFDTSYEDTAFESRGAFLRAFPRKSLENLELAQYVIGLHLPTFCTHVEAKTRLLGAIQGATLAAFQLAYRYLKQTVEHAPKQHTCLTLSR